MARGIEGNEIASSKKQPKAAPQPASSQKTQKTLLGFFSKKSDSPAQHANGSTPAPAASTAPVIATPAASSEAGDHSSPIKQLGSTLRKPKKETANGALPSPPTSAIVADRTVREEAANGFGSSPSRKVSCCYCLK